MRRELDAKLERAGALDVGAGMLDVFAIGRGTLDAGTVGIGADYSHRLTRGLSAYASGELGYSYGTRGGLGWRALVGLRGRF